MVMMQFFHPQTLLYV